MGQPESRHGKGPRPTPRWLPLPPLFYAQGDKDVCRRRVWGGGGPA
jgi:hypothetical protein